MEKWIIAALLLVLAGMIIIWYRQHRRQEREMADISKWLTAMIDGSKPAAAAQYEETLSSKIYHQLTRLQEITDGYHTEVEKDRDGIKKLIMEIAHQLRMPLSNMEAYLSFLQDESVSSKERQQYLQAVGTAEQKIHFLVESFIKMSRLEQRIIQIQKEDADLNTTLQMAVEQIEKRAANRGITLALKLPEHLTVAHDPNWLGEAVYNLLDNAEKYSTENTAIELGAEQNEMFVRIWVRDSGIGILESEENKVFQRFYRGSNITNQEGFGIGLYLTREIMTQHGGFVRLKQMTPGVCVELYLPAV